MQGSLPSSCSFSLTGGGAGSGSYSSRAKENHLGTSLSSGAVVATLSAGGAQESWDQVKATAMQPGIGPALMVASTHSRIASSYQPALTPLHVKPLPGGRAPASANAAVRVVSQGVQNAQQMQHYDAALRETSQGPRSRSLLREQSPRGQSVPPAPARYGLHQSMSAVPAPQKSSFESQLQSVTAAAVAQSAHLGHQAMQNHSGSARVPPGGPQSTALQRGLESLDERLKRLENSVEAKLVKSTSEAMNACVVLCKGVEDRLIQTMESSRSSLLDEVEKLIYAFGPGTDGYQGVGSDRQEPPSSSNSPDAPGFPEMGGRLKALEEAVFGSMACNLDHPRINSSQGRLSEDGPRIKDVDQAIVSALAVSSQAQAQLGQRGRGNLIESLQRDAGRFTSAPLESSAYNDSPPKVCPGASGPTLEKLTLDNDLDQVLDGLRGLETRMHLDSLQRANSSLPPSGLWNDPLNLKGPDTQKGLPVQTSEVSESIGYRPHEAESTGAEWSSEVSSLRTRLQNIILEADAKAEPIVSLAPTAPPNDGNVESAVIVPALETE